MNKIITTLTLVCLTWQIGVCQPAGRKMPVTTSSDQARELFVRARTHIENGELAPGKNLLNQALEIDPEFALAYSWLGNIQSSEKAMKLTRYVTPGESLAIRAEDANLRADRKRACILADSLLAMYPQDPSVLFFAANMFLATDRPKAIQLAEKAMELDPGYGAAINFVAYTYMEDGKLDQSGKLFRRYLELMPRTGNAHDSYGDYLTKTGKYDEASEEYFKAWENEPYFIYSINKAAWTYMKQGNYVKARKIFDDFGKKAANDDDRISAIFNRSLVSYVEGNMPQALADLDALAKKAAEINNPVWILNATAYKGIFLIESGDPGGGLKYLQKAQDLIPTLKLKPEEIQSAEMYVHGWKCMGLALNGKPDKAQIELDMASKIYDARQNSPQDENFMCVFRGVLEISRKNYQKAIDIMEPRVTLTGSVSNTYYTGLAYDRMGNPAKAINLYTRIIGSPYNMYVVLIYKKANDRLSMLKKRP